MSINILKYYLVDGTKNLFKNKRSTFASIVIMSFTLLLFGIFLIMAKNLNKYAKQIQDDEHIEVYIALDAKDSEIEELKKRIDDIKIDGEKAVVNIRYKSKDDAKEAMKKMLKEVGTTLKNLDSESNFLPASFLLKISKMENANKVKAEIEAMPSVRSVRHNQEVAGIIMNALKIIRIVSFVIILVLIISSVLIISNTIKLTVFARRKEISIMKYIGATDNFIRGPFVIESLLIGIISAIIPLILLGLIYKPIQGIIYNLNNEIGSGTAASVLSYGSLLPDLILSFFALGIGIAIFGNIVSMRRYLEV